MKTEVTSNFFIQKGEMIDNLIPGLVAIVGNAILLLIFHVIFPVAWKDLDNFLADFPIDDFSDGGIVGGEFVELSHFVQFVVSLVLGLQHFRGAESVVLGDDWPAGTETDEPLDECLNLLLCQWQVLVLLQGLDGVLHLLRAQVLRPVLDLLFASVREVNVLVLPDVLLLVQ